MRALVTMMLAGALLGSAACGGNDGAPVVDSTAAVATAVPTSRLETSLTPMGGAILPTASATVMATVPTATPSPTPSPTPTDTPVPTDTPAPTSTPEPEPTATLPPPPTATQPPPPQATAPPPAPAGGQSLFVASEKLKFSPATLNASAGQRITITHNNKDNLVPHNIAVAGLGTSATCQGPCTVTLSFDALAPGSYPFTCTIHPQMTGTLVVR